MFWLQHPTCTTFFLVHFCCKRVWSMEPNFHKFQHPHYHLVQVHNGWLLCSRIGIEKAFQHWGQLDPKTSGNQLAFQAHLLDRWLQSPEAWHGMHQHWGSTHPVGPCRFIFIDNPDLESDEPRVEERRRCSRDSLYKLFCLLAAMVMHLQADLDWNEMMQFS